MPYSTRDEIKGKTPEEEKSQEKGISGKTP